MTDNLVSLERPEDLDARGWNIDYQQLLTPKRGIYPYHYYRDMLFESSDSKYACLFYTITEYRMGVEAGLIGLFENKAAPTLIANPKNQWFDFQGDRSLVFSGHILFLRKLASHENPRLSGTPFILLNLREKQFGFIDFDFTSIYYSTEKIGDTKFRLKLDSPREIANSNLPNRDGQQIDISGLKYYPFSMLDSINQLFFDMKMKAC